jgi:hypothetical protein
MLVPHISDFLWSFVSSLNFMRLSLKLTTGFADPPGMKRNFLEIHSSTHTNSERVPHVRTSVRGLIKTGRSPSKVCLFLFPVTGFLLRKAHIPESRRDG